MEQNRWKSKVLWAGIIAIILPLLGQFGIYEALGITQNWLKGVLESVLALLALAGVVNNPTDSENL